MVNEFSVSADLARHENEQFSAVTWMLSGLNVDIPMNLEGNLVVPTECIMN
jgi:hypothetical protein